MKPKWFASALLLAPVCGCTEDLEHLKAIGSKLANRTPHAEKLGNMPWSDTARQLHSSISKAPLVHRVSFRLQFDKDLAEENVTTELKGPGQIELTGFVSTENHRERAGEIASRTLGVEEVVNNLKVGKPETNPSGENPKKQGDPSTESGSGDSGNKSGTGSPPKAIQSAEKGNAPSENKPTTPPPSDPISVRPAGNLGEKPATKPVSPMESQPIPANYPSGLPPVLGGPITIPPAPEKK